MTPQNSSVTVRPAQARDVDFICQSNLAMAAETEDLALDGALLKSGIEYLFNHPAEGHYFVAERDGIPAGTLMVTYEWSDWRAGRFWWIQSVYVLAEHRRHGVYRAMHNVVYDHARRDPQACGVRLYVEQNNDRAMQTYSSLGMAETHYRLFEELIR